jgi:hypothetical protein
MRNGLDDVASLDHPYPSKTSPREQHSRGIKAILKAILDGSCRVSVEYWRHQTQTYGKEVTTALSKSEIVTRRVDRVDNEMRTTTPIVTLLDAEPQWFQGDQIHS